MPDPTGVLTDDDLAVLNAGYSPHEFSHALAGALPSGNPTAGLTNQDLDVLNAGVPVASPNLIGDETQPVNGTVTPDDVAGPVASPAETEGASPTQPVSSPAPQARKPLSELDRMEVQDLGQVDSDYAAIGDTSARIAQITKEHYAQDAELAKMRSDLNLSWAAAEDKANSEAKAESQKYISAYQQQIAAVRQMAVDPTGPIGSLSTAAMGGLSLAMFAQGFLAARGIHIDVGGQIDRWVERSIQEQQRRIQQAEAGANDQLHLWEIAKQTSRDDYEARQRYRGFVIAAIQAQVEQHASGFQSDLANAQAADKVARLQLEADNTRRGIEVGHYQLVHQDRMDRAQIAHLQAQDALLDAQRQKEEAESEKLRALAGGKGFIPIDDPEDGQVKWGIDPTDKEAVTAAHKARAGYGVVREKLLTLQKAYQDAYGMAQDKSNYDVLGGGFTGLASRLGGGPAPLIPSGRLNEKVREFQRARNAAALTIARWGITNRINKDEIQLILSQMPGESAWQVGDNQDAIGNMLEGARSEFQQQMETYAAVGSHNVASPRQRAGYMIDSTTDNEGGVPDDSRAEFKNAADTSNEANYEMAPVTAAWSTLGGYKKFGRTTSEVDGKMPAAFLPVEHLALTVLDPDEMRKYAGNLPDNNDLAKSQARIALEQLSEDTRSPSHLYAREMLKAIDDNPAMWRTILLSDSSSGELQEPEKK